MEGASTSLIVRGFSRMLRSADLHGSFKNPRKSALRSIRENPRAILK